MKETILITGAGPNGVTGRRIKDVLEDSGKYIIYNPSSSEVDLLNKNAVNRFFSGTKIDYVIHCAYVSESRNHLDHKTSNEIEDNLRMFHNLADNSHQLKKMFYLGSGAEFDKSYDIIDAEESDALDIIPKDPYGFTKSILNRYSHLSENIYNIRLFGVINPYENPSRNVISNICAKVIKGDSFTMKKNQIMSFVDIDDVAKFIEKGFHKKLKYNDYNLVLNEKFSILKLVETIIDCYPIYNVEFLGFEEIGMKNEYTGSDDRIKEEGFILTGLCESLLNVYQYWDNHQDQIAYSKLDSRWK